MHGTSNKLVVGFVSLGLFAAAAWSQPLTLSIEPVPEQVATGGGIFDFEVFLTNTGPADFQIYGMQVDLPCELSAKPGAVGTIKTHQGLCTSDADCPLGVTCDTVGPTVCKSTSVRNASAAASGSIPWVFAPVPPNDNRGGGIRPIAQSACRFVGVSNAGEEFYIVPAGAKRYVGTVRYEVSDCAAGRFNINFEVFTTPNCFSTDLTRIDPPGPTDCVNFTAVASSVVVPVGCCVTGTGCVADHLNQGCCLNNHPGAIWREGRDCAECGCFSDAECDDGQFCNGFEICDPAVGCAPGDPPCTADETCDQAGRRCIAANIPTASAWGIMILSLALITGAKIAFSRRQPRVDALPAR